MTALFPHEKHGGINTASTFFSIGSITFSLAPSAPGYLVSFSGRRLYIVTLLVSDGRLTLAIGAHAAALEATSGRLDTLALRIRPINGRVGCLCGRIFGDDSN